MWLCPVLQCWPTWTSLTLATWARPSPLEPSTWPPPTRTSWGSSAVRAAWSGSLEICRGPAPAEGQLPLTAIIDLGIIFVLHEALRQYGKYWHCCTTVKRRSISLNNVPNLSNHCLVFYWVGQQRHLRYHEHSVISWKLYLEAQIPIETEFTDVVPIIFDSSV